MQLIRTIIWVLVTAILVAFVAMNWTMAPVNFWPIEGEGAYLHFEWPIGIIAILFFLLGFLPMWLLNRAQVWRLKRRNTSLENSLRTAALSESATTTDDAAATPLPETPAKPASHVS